MFEAVEFIEDYGEVSETILGAFGDEYQAIARGRVARHAHVASGRGGYAWWVVREQGATLARWIADSGSDREFAVDLTTGQLTEVG